MKPRNLAVIPILAIFCTSLTAQPRLIDREDEAKKYPQLQYSEDIQDKNVQDAAKRLSRFWYMVDMSRVDRLTAAMESKALTSGQTPEFEYLFRLLKYTPRNFR